MPKVSNSAPFGSLRLAKEYLAAATRIQAPATNEIDALRQRISFPAYFLVGHSIELSLKAFLLGRGMKISALRSRSFGHDLEALVSEARRRRIGLHVKLSAKEVKGIKVLNDCYAAKEFEYAVTGLRHLPPYQLVHATATRLSETLQSYCLKLASP